MDVRRDILCAAASEKYFAVADQHGLHIRDVSASTSTSCQLRHAPQKVLVDRDKVWIGCCGGNVAVVDARVGQVLHEEATHKVDVVRILPLIRGGVVVVFADGSATGWDSGTVRRRWSTASLSGVTQVHCAAVLPHHDDVLVLGTDNGDLYALSSRLGTPHVLVGAAHLGAVEALCATLWDGASGLLWTAGADCSCVSWAIQCDQSGAVSLASSVPKARVRLEHPVAGVFACGADELTIVTSRGHIVRVDAATGARIASSKAAAAAFTGTSVCDCFAEPQLFVKVWMRSETGVFAAETSAVVRLHGSSDARGAAAEEATTQLKADVQGLRTENQKLRQQLQLLLKSPLQHTLQHVHDFTKVSQLEQRLREAQAERDAALRDAKHSETASLEKLRACYASAIDTVSATEGTAREQIQALQQHVHHQASLWLESVQRLSHQNDGALEIRRRYHGLLSDMHRKQEELLASEQHAVDLAAQLSFANQQLESALFEAAQTRSAQAISDKKREDAISYLESENGRILLEAAQLREAVQHLRDSSGSLEGRLRSLEMERDDLAQRLSQNLSDMDALRECRAKEGSVDVKKLEQELNDLRRRSAETTDELRLQQHRYNLATEKAEQLELLVAALRRESSLHAEEARRASHSLKQKEDTTRNVESLLRELNDVKDALSVVEGQRDRLSDEVAMHLRTIAVQKQAVQLELSAMEAQLSALQRSYEESAELTLLQNKNAVLQDSCRKQEDELRAQRAEHRLHRQALEDKIIEITDALRRSEELLIQRQEAVDALEAKLVSREQYAKGCETALSSALADHRAVEEHVKKAEATARETWADAAKILEGQLAACRSELAKVLEQQQAATQEAKRHLAVIHAQHADELQSLQMQCLEHEKRLRDSSMEIERQSSAHESLIKRMESRYDRDTSELQEEKSALEHKSKVLADKLREKNQQLLELEKNADETIAQLQSQLRELQRHQHDAESQVEARMHKVSRDAKQTAADLVQATAQLTQVRAAHNDDVSKLTLQLTASRQECSELRRQLDNAKGSDALTEELAAAKTDLSLWKAAADRSQDEAVAAKVELEKALKMCRGLASEVALYKTEAEDLRLQVSHYSDKHRSTQRELDRRQAHIEELEATARFAEEKLSSETAKMAAQAQVQSELTAELRLQLKDALSGCDRLRTELDTTRATVQTLTEELLSAQSAIRMAEERHASDVANMQAMELSIRDELRGRGQLSAARLDSSSMMHSKASLSATTTRNTATTTAYDKLWGNAPTTAPVNLAWLQR